MSTSATSQITADHANRANEATAPKGPAEAKAEGALVAVLLGEVVPKSGMGNPQYRGNNGDLFEGAKGAAEAMDLGLGSFEAATAATEETYIQQVQETKAFLAKIQSSSVGGDMAEMMVLNDQFAKAHTQELQENNDLNISGQLFTEATESQAALAQSGRSIAQTAGQAGQFRIQ